MARALDWLLRLIPRVPERQLSSEEWFELARLRAEDQVTNEELADQYKDQLVVLRLRAWLRHILGIRYEA